jgi:hypothetical protein
MVTLASAVTIQMELGPFRSSDGEVLAHQRTMYVIVLDEDGDGVLPGSLQRDRSLKPGASAAVHPVFAGRVLAAGDLLGGDRILQVGWMDDEEGIGFPVITVQDFIASGVVIEPGRIYGFYWFPGHSGGQIPEGDFEVGGICELDLHSLVGAVPYGMKVPTIGSVVVTSVLDAHWGGNVEDSSRFTAIKTSAPVAPIVPPRILEVAVAGEDVVITVGHAVGLRFQLETCVDLDGEWAALGDEQAGQELPQQVVHSRGYDGTWRFYRLRWVEN